MNLVVGPGVSPVQTLRAPEQAGHSLVNAADVCCRKDGKDWKQLKSDPSDSR